MVGVDAAEEGHEGDEAEEGEEDCGVGGGVWAAGFVGEDCCVADVGGFLGEF